MKRVIVVISALFFLLIGCPAQKSQEIHVWTGNQVKDDMVNAVLHVHLADKPNGQAIIICPGGGYAGLCTGYEGNDFAPIFNKEGISLITLVYRLPNHRSEVPLADAEQAMRIVRSHAKDWGIQKIGIMGSSAGGHLASTLATHYTSAETRPDFQILLYPVITMDKSYTHMGTHDNLIGEKATADQEDLYSNEKHITCQTPPAFIVVSADDKTVPLRNTLNYTDALINHNVPCSVHIYPGGFHGFGCKADFKDADIWIPELLRWLKRGEQ